LRSAAQQAQLYEGGVLAGVELRGYRYLAVSQKRLRLPEDESLKGVVYRQINIAVRPSDDSRDAIKLAAKPKHSEAG